MGVILSGYPASRGPELQIVAAPGHLGLETSSRILNIYPALFGMNKILRVTPELFGLLD